MNPELLIRIECCALVPAFGEGPGVAGSIEGLKVVVGRSHFYCVFEWNCGQ